MYGQTEVAKHLIQSDVCNVNAQDIHGWTALISSACEGHTEIVKLVLQKDRSSIDVQNVESKKTALMYACAYGHAAIIELLIRSGANVDLKDNDNKTAFQLLDEKGGVLSQAEKTRLKDLPRLIRQEQLQQQ
jgi:ankyrin repeat protein